MDMTNGGKTSGEHANAVRAQPPPVAAAASGNGQVVVGEQRPKDALEEMSALMQNLGDSVNQMNKGFAEQMTNLGKSTTSLLVGGGAAAGTKE